MSVTSLKNMLDLLLLFSYVRLNHEHLSWEQIHQAVCAGVKRASDKYKICVGLIGILDRFMSFTEASKVHRRANC